jgi:hypothetical protein
MCSIWAGKVSPCAGKSSVHVYPFGREKSAPVRLPMGKLDLRAVLASSSQVRTSEQDLLAQAAGFAGSAS